MSIKFNQAILGAILFCTLALPLNTAHALNLEQMKKLPGADLLGLRVDIAFQHCGLPAAIMDSSQKNNGFVGATH